MKNENRVPPIGTKVKLKDGTIGTVACGWYAKGKGGWRIMLAESRTDHPLIVGLKDFKIQ